MTAKEYLKKIRTLDKDINRKIAEADSIRNRLEKVTPIISDMPPSVNDGPEDLFAKMLDLQLEITQDIDNLLDMKKEANGLLDKIDDVDCRYALGMYYLEGKNWVEVAYGLDYTLRWIQVLHSKGIKLFQKVLDSSL